MLAKDIFTKTFKLKQEWRRLLLVGNLSAEKLITAQKQQKKYKTTKHTKISSIVSSKKFSFRRQHHKRDDKILTFLTRTKDNVSTLVRLPSPVRSRLNPHTNPLSYWLLARLTDWDRIRGRTNAAEGERKTEPR